jgi:hypothetical protein
MIFLFFLLIARCFLVCSSYVPGETYAFDDIPITYKKSILREDIDYDNQFHCLGCVFFVLLGKSRFICLQSAMKSGILKNSFVKCLRKMWFIGMRIYMGCSVG